MMQLRTILPTLLFILFLGTSVRAQENINIKDFNPDDILIQGEQLPKVLLVGSFHFNYPNLDSHKTSAEDQVDIATVEKQAEVRELLDYIARFKPNKIVVERRAGSKINDYYKRYLNGNLDLPKGEIYQLGFRLGKRFNMRFMVSWE
ncbi:MAG: DUF5694 domain-containing protein [Bacteroidota bacterium]